MYKLVVFVPVTHGEVLKEALFQAGAGQSGNYDRCCWETEGWGQFRPRKEATPFLGKTDKTERVRELRIEMLAEEKSLGTVIAALKGAHPYEEPAYEYYKVQSPWDALPPRGYENTNQKEKHR